MKALLFAVLFFGVCVSVGRLIFRADSYAGDEARYSDALHILMNGSMAVMITFWTASVEATVVVLYVVAACLLLVRIRRDLLSPGGGNDARRTARLAGGWYHLVALYAMAFSFWHMPPSAMAMPMTALDRTVQHGWATLLLGCLFSLDAIVSTTSVVFFPAALLRVESAALGLGVEVPKQGETQRYHRLRTSLRWSLVPHLIMDLGMAVMLLGPT
jgi:hypothetical protein